MGIGTDQASSFAIILTSPVGVVTCHYIAAPGMANKILWLFAGIHLRPPSIRFQAW